MMFIFGLDVSLEPFQPERAVLKEESHTSTTFWKSNETEFHTCKYKRGRSLRL
jgi:hypothetical protein